MSVREKTQNQYFSLEDIARELHVSERTVYRWVRTGAIRAFRIGHITRVTKEDLQKFIDRFTVEDLDE